VLSHCCCCLYSCWLCTWVTGCWAQRVNK
jgi:hypothetical protein